MCIGVSAIFERCLTAQLRCTPTSKQWFVTEDELWLQKSDRFIVSIYIDMKAAKSYETEAKSYNF